MEGVLRDPRGVCGQFCSFPGYQCAGLGKPGVGVQNIARFEFQLCHLFSCVLLDELCSPSESQIQSQSLFIYMTGPVVASLAEYFWRIQCNAICAPPNIVPHTE